MNNIVGDVVRCWNKAATFEGYPLMINALLLISFLALAQPLLAQEQEEAAIDEIIIEGKRYGRGQLSELAADLSRFGTQVQLLTTEDIESGGYTNLGELGSGLIRGANIAYSMDEGEFVIRLDGGGNRDTLVLIDGVPTFDRGTPLENIWPQVTIDPRMIDTIEVIRGSDSIHFGSNAGLGTVNIRYKEPKRDTETEGEVGLYWGAFNTREIYGNVAFPIGSSGKHSALVFGRSYSTDSHEIFSEDAFVDNVLALGGMYDLEYNYEVIGAKYLWAINDETELRLGWNQANLLFHDNFPERTVYQPNYTEVPTFNLKFNTNVSDRIGLDFTAYYTAPELHNTELDPRICSLPRLQDLPADIQQIAVDQGITSFTNATQFEEFADNVGIPAGCVTNPYFSRGQAGFNAGDGWFVDENGDIYGTVGNPFPIGAPIGYVIQSVASFGTGIPVKGFGSTDQFKAGYIDYGATLRLKLNWNDHLQGTVGVQNLTYKDNSHEVYGMGDDSASSTGVFADIGVTLPFFEGLNLSFSGRQDFNNMWDDNSIWRYGLRQELLGGFYLRSNGGTSYSNPTLTEAGVRPNQVNNPDLVPYTLEAYSVGGGVNGEVWGGTFNLELGYIETEITNQLESAQISAVCPNFAIGPINPDFMTPTSFCQLAEDLDLAGNETAYFNLREPTNFAGYTFDAALDLEKWQFDLSYTLMDVEEPNPQFGLPAVRIGTGEVLDFVTPGPTGHSPTRQPKDSVESQLIGGITYAPSDRWRFTLNPRYQGSQLFYPEDGSTTVYPAQRYVDANDNIVHAPTNFGDYFYVHGSIQYFMGDNNQHRFMLRGVNLLDKQYFERIGASDRRASRAAVRGEMTPFDPNYHYYVGWNAKPRSFWLQYEYNFGTN